MDAVSASLVAPVQLLVQCANLVVSTSFYSLFLSADRVVRAARNFGVVVWLGFRVSHSIIITFHDMP